MMLTQKGKNELERKKATGLQLFPGDTGISGVIVPFTVASSPLPPHSDQGPPPADSWTPGLSEAGECGSSGILSFTNRPTIMIVTASNKAT